MTYVTFILLQSSAPPGDGAAPSLAAIRLVSLLLWYRWSWGAHLVEVHSSGELITLHRGLIGHRVVVRRVVPSERGASGGPALTDVIGTLEAWDDDTLAVRRADGDVVTIALADVVAGKPVPPPPAR